jgi:hypothetical protein
LTAGGLALETVVGNSTAGEVTVTSFGNVVAYGVVVPLVPVVCNMVVGNVVVISAVGNLVVDNVPFIKFDIFNNVVQPRSRCGFSKYLPNMCINNQIAKFSISQIIRLIAGTVLVDV